MGKPKRFNRKTHQKLTMDNQKKKKEKNFLQHNLRNQSRNQPFPLQIRKVFSQSLDTCCGICQPTNHHHVKYFFYD